MSIPFKSLRAMAVGGVATLSLVQPGSLTAASVANSDDPYLWLEDISGEKALNWVRQQNATSQKELESLPDFKPMQKRLLDILDSKEKIPYVSKHGAWYYNFWRDEKYVRGLWRRTSLAEFKKAQPAWETVLDLDQLAANEKENWVWKGYEVLYPKYDRGDTDFTQRLGADKDFVEVAYLRFSNLCPPLISGFSVFSVTSCEISYQPRKNLVSRALRSSRTFWLNCEAWKAVKQKRQKRHVRPIPRTRGFLPIGA